jgi:hypothetical protein
MTNLSGNVPNLVLAQRVINKMATAAGQYIEDETGEAMVGLVDPGTNTNGHPTLYVLDTIAPDESAVREMHTFQQGDERQYEIFTWLLDNWAVQREQFKQSPEMAKFDLPLVHLGDWHKQPGYMIAPSGGDLMSAIDQLHDRERGLDFLLVPIVTLGHPATLKPGASVNYVTVPDDEDGATRVDFWYIQRELRAFQPIAPTVYPDDRLPALAPLPWHIINEARASIEIGQLEHDNMLLSPFVLWNASKTTPLDICFIAARRGQTKLLILCTPYDFPHKPPTARVAPFVSMLDEDDIYDMFEKLWAQSEPVADPPNWKWEQDQYLIDYVHAVEDQVGITRAAVVAGDGEEEEKP